MSEEKNIITNALNTVVGGIDTVQEVTKSKSLEAVSSLIHSMLGKTKQKVETHLYLTHLQESVKNKGDGHIHIPKVSKLKRDAEYIHIPDVMQKILELASATIPLASEIINGTNSLINMLIGEDVKGVGYFLSKESQKIIASNSLEDMTIAKTAISEDLQALKDIENDPNKWQDKMKLSILYTAFDKAIFEAEKKQNSDNNDIETSTSEFDKKIEYLENTLQAGDILYVNPPNEKKGIIQNMVTNFAKDSMVDGKDGRDFTSIHAAVYVGDGKIRHIHRGENGEMSHKENTVRDFFTENQNSDVVYASIASGRLHLSPKLQNIFAKTAIQKSDEVQDYSESGAANAGLHGLLSHIGVSATELDTDDTDLICTDLPRISAKIILENLDENDALKIDKISGTIIKLPHKNKVLEEENTNNKNQKSEKQEKQDNKYNLIKVSKTEIKELKKLVFSNGTFQMFTKFQSPITMNIKDFTVQETTEKFE